MTTNAQSKWGALVESVMREDDGSHDPRRPSASAIGGCQRAAAWRLAGVPFSDDELGNPAAFIGSAIHERLAARIAARGLPIAIEHDVVYSYRGVNIPGRLDYYDTLSVLSGLDGSGSLVDIKTCGDVSWARAVAGKVPYEHAMQGNVYAAALEQAGYTVTELRWVFVHRASGRVTEYAIPYESAPARATLNARLDEIIDAAAAPETAEREGPGIIPEPGWSPCNSCPFRTACWPGAGADAPMGPHRREELVRADRLGMRYLAARCARDAAADDMAVARAALIEDGVWGIYGRTTGKLNARGSLIVNASQ